MPTKFPISQLEDEERHAHIRLAAFRAWAMRPGGSVIAFDRRLCERSGITRAPSSASSGDARAKA